MRRLEQLNPQGVKRSIYAGMARTARSGRAESVRRITETYNIKAKAVRDGIKTNAVADFEAMPAFEIKTLGNIKTRTKLSDFGARATSRGVSVRIKKQGPIVKLRHVRAKDGRFITRKLPTRKFVEVKSISVWHMFRAKAVQDATIARVSAILEREVRGSLNASISRLLR